MIKVTTLRWVPPFAQGLVRDLRVRWALEEAGLPYEELLVTGQELATAEFQRHQIFGQVPVYEEDGLEIFESGAIVMHIAEKSGLMPPDLKEKARARTWMFAALNSIEPYVMNLAIVDLFAKGEEWAKLRRPGVEADLKKRLGSLSQWLEGREYLEGHFTAGDLLMTTVLRVARHTDLVTGDPVLNAYVKRCEARPAFQRALAAPLAVFERNAPAST